jgi:hypothetical protein
MGDEKEREQKDEGPGVFAKIVDILAAIRLFFGELRGSLLEHADTVLRRVQVLFILYLWVSVGVLLMLLGAFQLVIDLGVSRGLVFATGGLLVTLVALIALLAMRAGRRK